MPELTPTRVSSKSFWARRDLFALNVLVMFIDAFGTEALSWRPETIEMEIRDEFDVDIDDSTFERLLVAIQILTTDSFTNSPPDFARYCAVLAGHAAPANLMVLPDSEDIAWGITEALLISPPEQKNPFGAEIIGFISEVLNAEGIIVPPDVLKIADRGDLSSRINYDYSDDPIMFEAVWKAEKSKTDDINSFVRRRMRDLLEQLQAAPLVNGKTAIIAKVLAKFKDTGPDR